MSTLLVGVTLVSLIAAAISLTNAWRVIREDRRRSEARAAAVSEAIYERATEHPVDVAPLLEDPRSTSRTRFSAVVLVACAVALVAGLTLAAARTPRRETSVVPPTAASNAPLELLALEQDREGRELIVRGLVRNPANGAARDALTAVVLAFDGAGNLVASARAAVSVAHLNANETTRFLVRIPVPRDVSRFRVSFRTGAHVETHVDRRPRRDATKDVAP